MMRKALSTGTMDAVSAVRMFLRALIRPKSRITLQEELRVTFVKQGASGC